MTNPIEWVKKHKTVAIVAGVGGVLVLLFALRGGGGGDTVTTTGASPQEIEANAQLGLAQISASSAAQQTQAEVTARIAEINAQTTLGQLQLQNANLESERQAQVAIYTVGQQAATEQNRIQTEEDIAISSHQTQLASNAIISNANVQGLQISANAQIAQAQLDSKTAIKTAEISAKATDKQGTKNLLGSIIGGAFSLFSDRRLKDNVEFLELRNGVRWYTYEYNDKMPGLPKGPQVGVIAQEVLESEYKSAVFMHNGFYAVDYSMLPEGPSVRMAAHG